MVAHLIRISNEVLPPEISRGFRENGITEESLQIKTNMTPRMSIIENLILGLQSDLSKSAGIISLLGSLQAAHEVYNGMTAQGDLFNSLQSILTTIDASFIFRGIWGNSKNWLKLNIEQPLPNFVCPNPCSTNFFVIAPGPKFHPNLNCVRFFKLTFS